MSSTERILTELQNFDVALTCVNVWTEQYACPLCAGQTTPLCQGRCNEVLIGCISSLQQAIVQLNVLLDFARGMYENYRLAYNLLKYSCACTRFLDDNYTMTAKNKEPNLCIYHKLAT